ncbi:hypothetical protein ACWDUH_31555, partial [Micromonospora wenchangensis]
RWLSAPAGQPAALVAEVGGPLVAAGRAQRAGPPAPTGPRGVPTVRAARPLRAPDRPGQGVLSWN